MYENLMAAHFRFEKDHFGYLSPDGFCQEGDLPGVVDAALCSVGGKAGRLVA